MRSLGTAIAAEAFTNKAPFSLPIVVYSINTPHVCCLNSNTTLLVGNNRGELVSYKAIVHNG